MKIDKLFAWISMLLIVFSLVINRLVIDRSGYLEGRTGLGYIFILSMLGMVAPFMYILKKISEDRIGKEKI